MTTIDISPEAVEMWITTHGLSPAMRDNVQALSAAMTKSRAETAAAYDPGMREAVGPLMKALRVLIDHTHECERELTEALHHVDFCGESRPLTDARAILAAIPKGGDA